VHISTDPSIIPSVTWLLCAHAVNSELQPAINSCLQQVYTDFELLVVANGPKCLSIKTFLTSTFDSDKRLRIITTPIADLRFSLSLGIHYSRASLIARMDSDDISLPDRLLRQTDFLNRNPHISIVGSFYEFIDAYGTPGKTIHLPLSNADIRNTLFYKNPLCHPSVMFRKSIVIEYGGYNGGIFSEDYDLWCRLSMNESVIFANIPYVCLQYRVNGVSPARHSLLAYSSMASTQLAAFLSTLDLRWLLGYLLSLSKLFFRLLSRQILIQ